MRLQNLLVLAILLLLCIKVDCQESQVDLEILKGEWILDMSPHKKSDENFAMMKITKVEGMTFQGEFYRDGVRIRNGNINTQLDMLYAALVSGDGSGDYYTTFYYKDGILHGTTHSAERDFLSVWTATKSN